MSVAFILRPDKRSDISAQALLNGLDACGARLILDSGESLGLGLATHLGAYLLPSGEVLSVAGIYGTGLRTRRAQLAYVRRRCAAVAPEAA